MKTQLLLAALTIIISLSTFAQGRSFGGFKSGNLEIEPVVGYERVQKILPTPHTSSRLFYGLRANYGPKYLSLEAEVTQAKEDESFDTGVDISDNSTNYMLGLRSSFNVGRALNWYLRAGAHARDSKYERTEAGVTTTVEPATYVNPYAGTGLAINLMNVFTLNAGMNVIFTDDEHEYQSSLGFGIRI
ncbi:outer membrane beta-barrel protein [Halobacteriovorax sp. GFR7]|uniref:outer membrane beta-barrel protein n=1 Tax=unclassified Halobacteriovorax TaxID=2639665 RepID=UPI00371F064C